MNFCDENYPGPPMTNDPTLNSIKVLAFDVFGTVVDWRSSIIEEGEQLGKAKASKSTGRPSPMHGAV